MDPDSLEGMVALCLRSSRLREETRQVIQDVRSTRAHTRALIAEAQHTHTVWPQGEPAPPAPLVSSPNLDPLAKEKLALHMIRAILDDFPIELQLQLIKVLAARTAVVAQDRLSYRAALSA